MEDYNSEYNNGYNDCLSEMIQSGIYIKHGISCANDVLKAEILKKMFNHLTIEQLIQIEKNYRLTCKF
jgi:hypothetical protein